MATTHIRRTTAVVLTAAGTLMASMIMAISTAAPAQAAGWGNLWTRSVNQTVTYTKWTYMGPKFTMAKNVRYRYCVRIKGNGSVNLQPTAFGTVVSTSSSYATRCTKSYVGTGSATQFQAAALMTKSGKSAYVSSITLQRYYSGPVPR